MLMAITSVMFYGNIMPFLYLVGVICIFVLYWFNKIFLCKIYKKPPIYDKSILNSIESLLLIPLIAHCIGGIIFMNVGPSFP